MNKPYSGPSEPRLNLVYYKVGSLIYVSNNSFNYGSVRNKLPYADLHINGKPLELSHSPVWYKVETDNIHTVEELVQQSLKKIGYKLKNPDLVQPMIPLKLTVDEVEEYQDEDYDTCWKKYSELQPLYETEYETIEGYFKTVEFTATMLGEVATDIDNIPSMVVNVQADARWSYKGLQPLDISDVTTYSELEQMLTPEFMLHTRPCSLSSERTYEIVRQYVKENIDPKQAVVTSDYHFCFTVKKKVAVKPYEVRTEEKKPNGKSYAKPRISTRKVDHKQVEVFEMTNDKDRYKGYTPIAGFKGDSLKDLIDNIKDYLDELMYHINVPVKECECCSGTGHIVDTKFEINKRG